MGKVGIGPERPGVWKAEPRREWPLYTRVFTPRLSFLEYKNGSKCYVQFGGAVGACQSNVDGYENASGRRKHVAWDISGRCFLWAHRCGGSHASGDDRASSESNLSGSSARCAGYGRDQFTGLDSQLPYRNVAVPRPERVGRQSPANLEHGGSVEFEFEQLGKQREQLFMIEP